MKKHLIMAALGLALAGVTTAGANAAPISGNVAGATEASTAVEKVHYRRHNHHYGEHRHHRNHGWRRWRPQMFGYMKRRHHHHGHHHHHDHRHSEYSRSYRY
jgi:hypothetical protein